MQHKFMCVVSAALGTAVAHQLHSTLPSPLHSNAGSSGGGAPVMVVSGISSPVELCLVAAGALASLQPCLEAVRAGDGRELFTYDDGELVHVGSKLCLAFGGDGVTLEKCGGRSILELQGNGQIKLGGNGSICLSQAGLAPGTVDVAKGSAVAATSTAASSHAAAAAVDGRATYWASKLDPAMPVELSVDFGRSTRLESASIQWEYPARSFSVLLSSDGASWEEAYSTDVNALKTTRIVLGGKFAHKAKVVLREAHPVYGKMRGHNIFGIGSLSFFSNQLETVAEDCSHAEQSTDARDKFFIVAAAAQDIAPLNRVRAALPTLDVAEASLATAMSALYDAMPLLATCKGTENGLIAGVGMQALRAHEEVTAQQGDRATFGKDGTADVDLESTEMLFKAARAAILHMRAATR